MPQDSYTDLEAKLARAQRELSEALEQQTATSDVLRVISSSPGELEPVFETILANTTRICEASFANLHLFEAGAFRAVAMHGASAAYAQSWRQILVVRDNPGLPLARVARTKKVLHITDLTAELAYRERHPRMVPLVEYAGARSLVTVPMLKDDELIGTISTYRREVRPFSDKQIALLTSFANQAVIAIENVRLLNELKQRTSDLSESLEQQTATSEVLRVISSSPGDLQPVFRAMLENATRLCEANFGNLFLYEGDVFHIVALQSAPSAWAERWKREPVLSIRHKSDIPLARLARTKGVVHVADLTSEQAYIERDSAIVALIELAGARTYLAVPMLKENELLGAIAIYRQEVRAFTDKQIALLTNFASQAVIAIENARLLNELRARTSELARSVEELRALGEVSQAVNSTLDLETVLTTIVAKAVQLSGTEAGAIYTFDKSREEFRLRATHGMDEAIVAAIRDRRISIGETAIGKAAAERAPVQISDALKESSLVLDLVVRAGYRALLIVPMLRPDHIVGALVVRRKAPGEFPASTVELLQTFGDQSVLAIQNARLFREIDEKSRELEVASKHKSQFLANMSHELRTPLNAVLGYTELILDSVYGEMPEKARSVLDRVQRNGRHLLGPDQRRA